LYKIQKYKFHTAADQQHFRFRTLLFFHNPGAKRARHAAFGGITPRSGVGASSACVPGAARFRFRTS
jgi:hypothetical protein